MHRSMAGSEIGMSQYGVVQYSEAGAYFYPAHPSAKPRRDVGSFVSGDGILDSRALPHVRAITAAWNDRKQKLLMHFYFDSAPTAVDSEWAFEVMSECYSCHWADVEMDEMQCIYVPPHLPVERLDVWLYKREG